MKAKILLVEDDDYFRDAICELLRRNYDILAVSSGKVARDVMKTRDFNLVLSDIQIPGLNGLELLNWSKTHKPVPFVFMTGFAMDSENQLVYEMGAKGFVPKPFKREELISVLQKVLGPSAT